MNELNTNWSVGMFETFVTALELSSCEDTYVARIKKLLREGFAVLVTLWRWSPTPLDFLLAKYVGLLIVLCGATIWSLVLYGLINLETLLKLLIWVGVCLPTTLLVIMLVDIRWPLK